MMWETYVVWWHLKKERDEMVKMDNIEWTANEIRDAHQRKDTKRVGQLLSAIAHDVQRDKGWSPMHCAMAARSFFLHATAARP